MRDLEEFLQGQAQHGLKPLGLGGLMVPDGSHMTHFYSGKDEALEVSAAYVIEGLKHGELVLAVMPPERGRELLASIERQGHPVEIGLKSGQLFVSEGMDSPEEMIRYLASFAKMAGQFRLVGDGVWAIRKGWGLAALRTLEEAGNSLRSREGKLFLCQYSLADFSGAHIMMAAEAHTHVIYKGSLEKSPYYRQVSQTVGPVRGLAS